MRNAIVFLTILLVVLAGCAGGKKGETVDLGAPFVGGTSGLIADFIDYRAEVFDGGRDPFDVVVKLENRGESTVAANRVRVKLSGVNPAEFGKVEEDLSESPTDELFGVSKDPQGVALMGGQATVEFTGLNHFSPIAGASVTLPLRADICYLYSTKAVSKLCVREDILNPDEGGICEINQDKPVFNSGAPVQVASVKEAARGKDKVSITFDIMNAGTGQIFERGSGCDRSTRAKENRVYVIVDSGMPGLACTGLATSGTKAEGFVTLFDGKKTVTCTQGVSSRTDFEQQVRIEAVYDYEEYKQTEITVKSSGESPVTS